MTPDQRSLLIKDITARLPYGVKYCRSTWNYEWDQEMTIVETLKSIDDKGFINSTKVYTIEDIKPCLRSIGTMTDAEMDKLFDILHIDKLGNDEDWIKINEFLGIKFFFKSGKWIEDVAEAMDYLNSIHIDYRGLIKQGLAIEAANGVYNLK